MQGCVDCRSGGVSALLEKRKSIMESATVRGEINLRGGVDDLRDPLEGSVSFVRIPFLWSREVELRGPGFVRRSEEDWRESYTVVLTGRARLAKQLSFRRRREGHGEPH